MQDDIPAPSAAQDDPVDPARKDMTEPPTPEDLETLRIGDEVLGLDDVERPD